MSKRGRRSLPTKEAPRPRAPAAPPPRRRWARRFVRVAVVLILLVVAGHWLWARAAQSDAADLADQYRRVKEPVLPDDFRARHPVVEARNAAPALRAALGRLVTSGPAWAAFEGVPVALPLDGAARKAIGRMVEQNEPAIRAAHYAVRRPEAEWDVSWATPLAGVRGPGLADAQRLARVLRAAALLAHALDDDRDAVQHVRTLVALARAVEAQGLPASHAVAVGISSLAARTACELAPDLRVPTPCGPLLPRLIAELADDRWLFEGDRRALLAYRATVWDTARELVAARLALAPDSAGVATITRATDDARTWAGVVGAYAVEPWVMNDAAALMRQATRDLRQVARADDYPTFAARTGGPDPDELERDIAASPRAHFFAAAIGRPWPARGTYRAATERQLAAAALAAAWYARDHAGRPPASLGALVGPGYAAAVPLDRMAAGAPPIRLATVRGVPVVYSVGDDGIDSGAADAPPGVTAAALIRLWDRDDVAVPLRRPTVR